MSMRHLLQLQDAVANPAQFLPVNDILKLPETLELQEGYDPCAFGTPGGAPRMLSTNHPVIVHGPHTYVYTHDGQTAAYFKFA